VIAAVTLLVIGLILLFCEVLLPGMILGMLSLLCLGGSIAAGYMNTDHGHIFLCINLASICAFTAWFVIFFPNTKFVKKISSQSTTVGELDIDHTALLNQIGEAFTDLRPSGKANIQEQRVDVVTEGVFLEKGDPVKVIKIQGQRIVVRKI
jgi:membrane-bound serine protease (ClpP class)